MARQFRKLVYSDGTLALIHLDTTGLVVLHQQNFTPSGSVSDCVTVGKLFAAAPLFAFSEEQAAIPEIVNAVFPVEQLADHSIVPTEAVPPEQRVDEFRAKHFVTACDSVTVATVIKNIIISFFIIQSPDLYLNKNHQFLIGGQEVENNHKNCAAYSIYSHALLTQIRSLFFVVIFKNGANMRAIRIYSDACERVLTPHQQNTC